MMSTDDFDERVKQIALEMYEKTGIKGECERCFYVIDPKCPDFPHICALEKINARLINDDI